MADLLGATPRGIVHGRSMTALTYDVSRALAATWAPGDEVVVTRLDHDANIRPWVQAATRRSGGPVGRRRPADGELTADALVAVLSERTRLVAFTAGVQPHRHDAGHPGPHRSRPRRRGPRLCRRGPRDGPRARRPPGPRRGLLRLLSVQAHGAALRCARRRPGAARHPPPGQAAAGDRRSPRALRARHLALRGARGMHRDGRLRRLARRPDRSRPACARRDPP